MLEEAPAMEYEACAKGEIVVQPAEGLEDTRYCAFCGRLDVVTGELMEHKIKAI